MGALAPSGIGACPGPDCPYGPEWIPPCMDGGPLAGTTECEQTLAGLAVGPCAPGGSAYGDAEICPWTVTGAAIASAGGFFGVTSAGTPATRSSGALTAAAGMLSGTGAPATTATPTTAAASPETVSFSALGAGTYTPGQFLWGIAPTPAATPAPVAGTPSPPVLTFPAPSVDPFGDLDPFAAADGPLGAFYDVPLGEAGEFVTPWGQSLGGDGNTPVADAFSGALGVLR